MGCAVPADLIRFFFTPLCGNQGFIIPISDSGKFSYEMDAVCHFIARFF